MINGKRVLAITLARGGSKRIPFKNIVPLNGVPLLYYTIDEVTKSKFIDKYVVSTDSDRIDLLCKYKEVEVHRRSEELSQDITTSADSLIDVAKCYPDYDYIVEIMCTNPLKTVEDIDSCIEKLDDTGADSVVSVVRVWDNHPSRVKHIENDKLVDFYPEIPESRRQDLTPPAYVRNGSIYATTSESLLRTGRRLGEDTRPYIMPEERTINIDEPIDLIVAKSIIDNEKDH